MSIGKNRNFIRIEKSPIAHPRDKLLPDLSSKGIWDFYFSPAPDLLSGFGIFIKLKIGGIRVLYNRHFAHQLLPYFQIDIFQPPNFINQVTSSVMMENPTQRNDEHCECSRTFSWNELDDHVYHCPAAKLSMYGRIWRQRAKENYRKNEPLAQLITR